MLIVLSEKEKEGPSVVRFDQAARGFRHLYRTAPDRGRIVRCAGRAHGLETGNGFGPDMEFPDLRRAVIGRREEHLPIFHRVERWEMRGMVLKPMDAVTAVGRPCEHDRARRTAARRGAKGVRETRPVRRQRVEMRRRDRLVFIAAQRLATAVSSDDEDDLRGRDLSPGGAATSDDEGERQQAKPESLVHNLVRAVATNGGVSD